MVFHEYVFPFELPNSLTSESSVENVDAEQTPADRTSTTVIPIHSPTLPTPVQSSTSNDESTSTVPVSTVPVPTVPQGSSPTATAPVNETGQTSSAPIPTSTTKQQQEPTLAEPSQSQNNPPQQQPKRVSTRQRKPVEKLNLSAIVFPTSVAEALKDPRWRKAMCEEINAQLRNHTWDLHSPVQAANIVGCKWVFTIKRNVDGSVERFKARLVAKGFNQKQGLDYQDTFRPVVKPATIRLVLSVAVSHQWPIRQFDVNHAFLQGKLDETVYMMQPPGFINQDNPTAVCKLNKEIYGLKQEPRAWYNELRRFLLASGFTNSLADASLFVYNSNGTLLYMLVYVDDNVLTGNNTQQLDRFIQALSTRFSLKDLGSLSYFLGIEAHHSSHGLLLSQRRYVADLLKRTKMENCNPTSTPMCPYKPLTLDSGKPLSDPTQYRATVGSLQYLSLTRPDISFAVNKMSQFMHKPTDEHWNGVKRILRYLSGSMSTGIFLSSQNAPALHAFTDTDWAGNRDDYTSTGAYIVYTMVNILLPGHQRSKPQ